MGMNILSPEYSKADSLIVKGIAIIGMVMLHLFCRLGELSYTPWIWIGDTPLIYYLGLFGDMCVPIFCFCSGYAHYLLREAQGSQYKKHIWGKLLRFLCNYWIVVILFSVMGLLFGAHSTIPKSLSVFLGNLFLYRMSYNGAWWFVLTYVFLLFLSPFLASVINKLHTIAAIVISGILYFVAYLFRFKIGLTFPNPVLDWFWQQFILLGTSLFGYVIGMTFCKERWISKLRTFLCYGDCLRALSAEKRILRIFLTLLLPAAAFIGHCIVQSMFVAPFTAMTVLVSLFVSNLPRPLEKALIFLGKHSTNIWLVHMFYYLTLFKGLVFHGKYPIVILTFLLILCIITSFVINLVCSPVCKQLAQKKSS